jgi:hypothetical protein
MIESELRSLVLALSLSTFFSSFIFNPIGRWSLQSNDGYGLVLKQGPLPPLMFIGMTFTFATLLQLLLRETYEFKLPACCRIDLLDR